MKEEEVDLYSWAIRGSQRRKILKVMDKPKIPTEIKEETKLALNNVSDILRSFVKKGVAKCLNEKEKVGRIYTLTNKGKTLRDRMRK